MITIHQEDACKASDKIRVTFTMTAQDCVDALYLVGWFSEWNEAVYRMERAAGNEWTLTLELEPGCEYLYRYRTLDGRWLSDPAVPQTGVPLEPKNSFFLSAAKASAASAFTH